MAGCQYSNRTGTIECRRNGYDGIVKLVSGGIEDNQVGRARLSSYHHDSVRKRDRRVSNGLISEYHGACCSIELNSGGLTPGDIDLLRPGKVGRLDHQADGQHSAPQPKRRMLGFR